MNDRVNTMMVHPEGGSLLLFEAERGLLARKYRVEILERLHTACDKQGL
jgi:hypothetical protein